MGRPFPYSILRISVSTMNTAPSHLVERASLASRLCALFLDIKDSERPPIDVERPADFPDCRSTTRTIDSPHKTCNTVTTLYSVFISNLHSKVFSQIFCSFPPSLFLQYFRLPALAFLQCRQEFAAEDRPCLWTAESVICGYIWILPLYPG